MPSLPQPITDLAQLKAIGARFVPQLNAAAKENFVAWGKFLYIESCFSLALKTAEDRGMPTDDTVFETLIATDVKDLDLKIYMRFMALLQHLPAGSSLEDVICALKPMEHMSREANRMAFLSILGSDVSWPVTLTL